MKMERLSNRESVLLGYSPQRNTTNNHLISSPDSSDIDFHDVFGGPPRRASTQETRYSFGENDTDSYALTSTSSHRHRWSGLSEKPVFGDDGANRRRYTSHDFFDDVFGGNDYLVSSPRKDDRGSFSSNPGSKVLSPVRRLPSRASEPFASSSVPSQFSLPAKLIKGTDLPTFRLSARDHQKNKDGTSMSSSYYAHSPLSKFSSQANQVQVEWRSDVYIGNSLSRAPSAGSLESLGMVKRDEMDKGNDLKKDQSTSRATSNSNQFHFSIYKWASKGVPLAWPIRGGKGSKLKGDVKLDRSSSASGRIVCEGLTKELGSVTSQDTDRPLCDNSIPSDAKSFMVKLNKKEKGSLIMTSTTNGRVEQEQTVEEAVLRFEPESQRTDHETVKYNPGVISQDSKEGTKSHSVIDTGKSGKGWQKNPGGAQDAPRTELKTLRSLMSATQETTTEKELKESKVKGTKKSAAIFNVGEKAKKQIKERTAKANFQSSPKFSEDSFAKSRSTGKVKEFVKIFNEEASNNPAVNIDSESPHNRSSRWKERSNLMPKDDPSTNKVDVEVHFPDGDKNHKKPGAFIRVDEFLKQPEEQHSNAETRTNNLKPNVISSGLEGRSAATEASKSDGAGDEDDSFQGNILIKELILDDDEQPQARDNQGDFQVIDAKIRKWSIGKEGNIRSLLSTLQYVLWPGSGWKPVPLVDIIEGNAVKRSYQKALLSLHPDKLQQKGATSHQKYTAEKVFDTLQEAWTQFNTVGSV